MRRNGDEEEGAWEDASAVRCERPWEEAFPPSALPFPKSVMSRPRALPLQPKERRWRGTAPREIILCSTVTPRTISRKLRNPPHMS